MRFDILYSIYVIFAVVCIVAPGAARVARRGVARFRRPTLTVSEDRVA